jgi:Predicted amidohydrolase
MKLSLVQMLVGSDKEENVRKACGAIKISAQKGAQMVVLPEMFACPYDNASFVRNAEEVDGFIYHSIAESARENGVWVVAGSFPEREGKKLFNTSFVFDDLGNEIAHHRKLHLFDINIEGGQRFCESDTFSAGDEITVFDTPFGRMGLMICFDLRFGELSRAMALAGAKLLLAPAAFNKTTGPMHWDLILRTRAVDNGVFVAAVSPARDESASYIAYGHSALVSPWGELVCRMGSDEAITIAEVDFSLVEAVRRQLPILSARRTDLY